jgi:hypothetical protein
MFDLNPNNKAKLDLQHLNQTSGRLPASYKSWFTLSIDRSDDTRVATSSVFKRRFAAEVWVKPEVDPPKLRCARPVQK